MGLVYLKETLLFKVVHKLLLPQVYPEHFQKHYLI